MSRTLVITGASSGIGRALALELAKPDVTIWLIARRKEELEKLAKLLEAKGATPVVAPIDLAIHGELQAFVDSQIESTPVVDEVYHCAASSSFGPVDRFSAEDWRGLYNINILAMVDVITIFYRQMARQRKGKLVLVGSLAGYTGFPLATPYSAMKEGLIGIYRSLKHETAYHGVALHLVVPGFVETTIFKNAVYRGYTHSLATATIKRLGFKMMSAEEAACKIRKGIDKGKEQIIFPFYARLLMFAAQRIPFVLKPSHATIIKCYRDQNQS